jgi:hypothetical protein
VEARNGDLEDLCRPVVVDLYDFNQDPDPIQHVSKKPDLDPHLNEKLDPDPLYSDVDP